MKNDLEVGDLIEFTNSGATATEFHGSLALVLEIKPYVIIHSFLKNKTIKEVYLKDRIRVL